MRAAGPALHSSPASLLGSFLCPKAASALQAAVAAVSGPSGSEWRLDWSLLPPPPSSRSMFLGLDSEHKEASDLHPPPAAHAAYAVFRVDLPGTSESRPHAFWMFDTEREESPSRSQKDFIIAAPGAVVEVIGSPFGCLAPSHFSSCTFGGRLSALLPSDSHDGPGAVMIVDAACLPGMEGSIVVPTACEGGPASLPPILGLLCCPLSRCSDGVQLHLVVAWREVEHGLRLFLLERSKPASRKGLGDATSQLPAAPMSPPASLIPSARRCDSLTASGGRLQIPAAGVGTESIRESTPIEQALKGVVLVKAGGSWASGVRTLY